LHIRHVPKPVKSIGFGDIRGPNPCKIKGFAGIRGFTLAGLYLFEGTSRGAAAPPNAHLVFGGSRPQAPRLEVAASQTSALFCGAPPPFPPRRILLDPEDPYTIIYT
jgi:hypothetical protein